MQEKRRKKGEKSIMEVTFLKGEKKGSLAASFVLEKSNVPFVNSLRRAAMEEVTTMAIEEVEIRKNSSVLYDEVLAHRLGLIPIKTDLKSYNLRSECPCKGAGCAQCTLKLSLKAKGPAMVYASEIESTDPKSIPVFPKTPIVKLLKGQSLEIEMIAVLGQGKEHAKWTPGLIHYKYKPAISISKKGQTMTECIKVCPQEVFDKSGDQLSVNEKNLFNCHLCGACEDCSGGEVRVEKDVKNFVFYVESWGGLSCEDIMMNSVDRLDMKLDDFAESFKKSENSTKENK
jgi:DNA-directed RNA polymerase subunit D